MAAKGTVNPNSLTRQSREKAIRQAKENYKNDLNTAAKSKENAINNATMAKAEAIKQARAALEMPKKRLSEARDRIETRFRIQDLDEARRQQEQMLIKAEAARVKAFKQADELGKRMAAEAGETYRQAIQKTYENEKKMKLEINQALKLQKEIAHTRVGEDPKARQMKEQVATETKIGAQKTTAVELSAREAIAKTNGATKTKEFKQVAIAKPPEVPKPAAEPIINKKFTKAIEPAKSGELGVSVSRTGMVKLVIIQKDAGSDYMADFENSLREIPDIRLVMIGGTTSDGAQIIVSSGKSSGLSDILRQLPMVKDVTDRPTDILVKLKPVVILAGNI